MYLVRKNFNCLEIEELHAELLKEKDREEKKEYKVKWKIQENWLSKTDYRFSFDF